MPEKESIRSLFNGIAPSYDRLNRILSLGIDRLWRRSAVDSIVYGDKPINVLDVATGTGDFAFEIAEKAPMGSLITGIDISENMLNIAKQKSFKISKIVCKTRFLVGDSENLQYEDGAFDRVSVAFGIRNFEKLNIGLSEMYRVLKKGGRLVILELSYPDSRLMLSLYKLYSLHIIPMIGSLIARNKAAYTYLPNSIMNFPKPIVMVPKLYGAGFQEVKVKSFTFGVCRMYVAVK